jgi:phage-related minor tail protein
VVTTLDLAYQERAQRVAQERGVRRYLEQRLRQVAENCEKTWKRVFDQDIDLATALRTNSCKPYTALADRVRAADYRTGQYLSRDEVPLDDIIKLLALTEGVLEQAEAMIEASQDAYNAAAVGDLNHVRNTGLVLDQGCLEIGNRFAEREQFLLR